MNAHDKCISYVMNKKLDLYSGKSPDCVVYRLYIHITTLTPTHTDTKGSTSHFLAAEAMASASTLHLTMYMYYYSETNYFKMYL